MNAKTNTNASQITPAKNHTKNSGARYLWIGFTMGLACMAALFIAGLITGNAGMTVMASSTAAVLGAVWTSTAAAAKKAANKCTASVVGA